MRVRPGESWHAAGACAVQVGAARHCNGSAFPPGQAYPPHCERVHCDGVRCSGADRRGERRLGLVPDPILPLRAGSP